MIVLFTHRHRFIINPQTQVQAAEEWVKLINEQFGTQLEIPQIVRHLVAEESRPGESLAAQGFSSHNPVILIPGVISTGLELWQGETCASHYFRQRLWGSATMLRSLLLDPKCWLRHIALNHTTGQDRDGIKLRPASGLEAADFFIGNFWIWARVIENLADIGYDTNSLAMAAYDWRAAPLDLELRDSYFTRLASLVEIMSKSNEDRPVSLVMHSSVHQGILCDDFISAHICLTQYGWSCCTHLLTMGRAYQRPRLD